MTSCHWLTGNWLVISVAPLTPPAIEHLQKFAVEFRHSSATYYASKLNRQQLCIRYGWAISSRMPDTYFTRSGVDMEELDKKFTGTEVEVLKGLLARMEQETQL